jgi:1-acyl-sn-glycerol-3-phosphate acyltransferase
MHMANDLPAPLPQKVVRVIVRGTALAWGVAGCLAEYGLTRLSGKLTAQDRTNILHKWCQRTLPRMGVLVDVMGVPPDSGLTASNHLSYLDILVFSAVAPCSFVSKQEVRSWPAVGWIATLAGAVYVDRSRRSETHSVLPEMQSALANHVRLVLFPEGTSSDGSSLLPFHSSLFQPAVVLQAPITAACISYALPDGIAGTEACYWGKMSMFPHLLNLLTKNSVRATLKFASEPFRFTSRKQAAQQMQAEVERLREVPVEVLR